MAFCALGYLCLAPLATAAVPCQTRVQTDGLLKGKVLWAVCKTHDLLWNACVAAEKRKDYDEAIRLLKILYRETDEPDYLRMLGGAHYQLKMYTEALQYYELFWKKNTKELRLKRRLTIQERVQEMRQRFSKQRREVQFLTQPQGATIWFDGRPLPTSTPTTVWINPGEHLIEFGAPWHRRVRRKITFALGPLLSVSEALQPQGKLSVTVARPDAMIFVDGKLAGRGGVQGLMVDAGLHRVTIRAKGVRSETHSVQVAFRKHEKLQAAIYSVVLPDPRIKKMRTAGWATLGVGLALGLSAVPLYLVARRRHDRANDDLCKAQKALDPNVVCGSGVAAPQSDIDTYNAEIKKTSAMQAGSIALVSVGGALVVTSLVLLLLKPKHKSFRRWRFTMNAGPGQVEFVGRIQF